MVLKIGNAVTKFGFILEQHCLVLQFDLSFVSRGTKVGHLVESLPACFTPCLCTPLHCLPVLSKINLFYQRNMGLIFESLVFAL